MISRINIIDIIKDHLNTLRSLNQNSNRIYWKDFLLFFLIPVIIATYLSCNGYTFIKSLGNLITGISILGGFLFNLLAIIYGQIDKIKADINSQNDVNSPLLMLKKKFVNEIHSNISFCIILSIIIILALLLMEVDIPSGYNILIHKFLIAVNYSLLILFTLTLLMVINRVYILLKKETE